MRRMRNGRAVRSDGRSGSRARALALVVVALTVLAAGCASLGRAVFKEPVVNFKEVRLNGLGISGGSLDIVLSVYNPNGFKLDATRLTYNLLMDSVKVADGELGREFVVPSGDSSTVTIPVNFTYSGLGAVGSQLIRNGSVNYRVRGDFTVNTPLGDFTRPYDQTGRFTALRGAQRD